MTWRAIHDSIRESERLAALTADSERLYWRIIAQTDAYGRMRGESRRIWAACVPLVENMDVDLVEACLVELESFGFIVRYQTGTCTALAVAKFEDYQPSELLRRRGAAQFPDPPAQNGTTPGVLPELPGLLPPRRKERKGEERSPKGDLSSSHSTSASERRIFDHAAEKLGHRWKFTKDRQAKIRARLRDGYSEDELLLVVDGVLLDPWEGRREPGNDDPKVIFRDGTHVEKFISLAAGAGRNGGVESDDRRAERLRAETIANAQRRNHASA